MMKSGLVKFDKFFGGLIGRLPQAIYKPFEILCAIVRPSFWMGALGSAAAALFMVGESSLAWAGLTVLFLVPLSTVSKFITRRQRPVSIYTDAMKVKSYSFPSSHAYSSALAGGFIAVISSVLVGGLASIIINTLIIALTIKVGVARVYLGAHFPSDVAGGFALGVGVLLAVISLFKVI